MEGYHGYLLFAWMYGACVGGLNFSLATFVLERSRIRHFARDWGFVQGARAIPLVLGVPIIGKGCKKEQVWQCLGFCTADLRSWLVYESAVQKPKHCLFLLPMLSIVI